MAELAEPAPAPTGGPEADIDERFEYDAPRFYDFDEGSPTGAPAADGWFDTDGPKGLTTPLRAGQQDAAGPKPPQGDATCAAESENAQHAAVDGKGGKAKGGCSDWRRALGSITNTTKGGQQGPVPQPANKRAKRKASGDANSGGAAVNAAAGDSKSGPAPSSAPLQQQQKHRQQQVPRTDDDATAAPPPQAAASRLRLHSRPRSTARHEKTSEQEELERVQLEKQAAAALKRRNAEAVKHVRQPPAPAVAHSNRPLTEPQPLELCTSKRRRMHGMETRSMASPFKSTAEQIAAFEGRLPSKSRLAPGSASAGQAHVAPKQQQHLPGHGGTGMAGLTVPMSPQFATKRRVRPPRFKPREVVEAEEMAAMPKFKARPVNKRILKDKSGQLGVPQVGTKPPTVPEPFALKTDQQALEHDPAGGSAAAAPAGSSGAAAFVFGAQGEGMHVARSKGSKKKAAWTQLTQTEPFVLATDARGGIKRNAADEPQHEQQEARAAKRARKTAAGPFQLATDQRGAAEEARIEGMRRQQEAHAQREAEFKALPLNKAVLAGAWKPPPMAPHELTVPRDVMLHSEVRAVQRHQFDQAAANHAAELEAERQHLQALQQQQEEEKVQRMRKNLGHKALPLPGRL